MKDIRNPASRACGWLAGVALVCAAAPAMGQATVEELTITGRYGRAPDSVQSLSQAVGYADLDLSTDTGKRELRRRVALTARYLCEKLGETETANKSALPSCRETAEADALKRAGTLEEGFAPRGTTWAAGPAWAAPYPSSWTYP